jgi:hypothetical protein
MPVTERAFQRRHQVLPGRDLTAAVHQPWSRALDESPTRLLYFEFLFDHSSKVRARKAG